MQIVNHKYANFEELRSFLGKHKIQNSNSLLIQIFSSNFDESDLYRVRDELLSLLRDAVIIGTSSAGNICDGNIKDNEITISFSIFENSTVKSKNFSSLGLEAVVEQLSENFISNKTKLLLCFVNTFKLNSEQLLKQITQKYPNIIIAGGNSADNFKFEKCIVFSDASKDSDLVFAAIDSDVLSVETKYLLKWQTIGKELIVTKSDGSRLYEIDNKNVLDTYEYYLGKEIRDNILQYSTEFPLIFKDNGIDVARAPIVVHDDGSLTFAGELQEGTKIKFGYANIEYIDEFNQQKLLDEYKYKSEAIYVYSCSARRSMIGNYLNDEISIINSLAPTSGFITYGEFFHNSKSCSNSLLNITTTYVILNENKENKKLRERKTLTSKSKNNKDIALKALTTLVSRTSAELDENIYYLEQFKRAVDEAAIISTTDKKGNFTDVNENFEKISGYTKEELLGKAHNLVRHPDMPKEFFEDMWKAIKKDHIWKGLVKNKTKKGKAYYVLSEISSIYNKDGSFKEYVGIRNDVTELEEYKHLLKKKLDTTSYNLEENINYTDQYEKAINSTTAILKTDINNIIIFANEKFCKLSGYALSELIGKNCIDIRYEKHKVEKKCEDIKNILACKKTFKMILTNITKDGKKFTVNNLFCPIVDLEGNVVEHLQVMYDLTEIIELNNEIESTQKEVVLTMGAIGETRSKETGQHVRRVAEYSYLLAKLAGLSEEEASLLKQASPMHDIGKVGIPDNILNKPGKLTSEEFDIMKTHSEIGYEMLKHSNRKILKASSIVAYTHHEKYDGSGYPNAIKGEDIHIYGRITAIADVFDALGHDRCYKKAWKLDDILALFQREKGTHFDAKLIDLFFEHLDEFLKIRDEMIDNI
nr:PAS domain S-box protein [uncultured Sulfurimonas sp.]